MNKNILSIPNAISSGVIDAKGYVHYNVRNANGKVVAGASYPFLGSVEATLNAKCCFFGKTPYVSEDGIQIRMEGVGGTYAELIIPAPYKIVFSAMNGTPVCIPENTPFCCDPSTETYWSM